MTDVTASQLMAEFAIRTGLVGTRPAKRYLWTDAFAVCNFLGLFVVHRNANALLRARTLVDQTHRVLGRHRTDDHRTGWLSGLNEEEGARHPTIGGLRIGKALPERAPGDTFDPELEWERDGQYFHYLTKWMLALRRMTDVTGDAVYHRWAVELAQTAHRRFAAPASTDGMRGLYWKMSIDLSGPQVPSMGHHDPLDGLLTFQQLQSGGTDRTACDLSPEIGDLAKLCAGCHWDTDDPLGLGGLMCDAFRLAHLLAEGAAHEPALLSELLAASIRGLDAFRRQRLLDGPAASRLAFREFGLSIGLHAIGQLNARLPQLLRGVPGAGDWAELVQGLARSEPIAAEIEQFWQASENRESSPWQAHRDINEVMFATSLAPGGFLGWEA
jgi:hypothetical protein